MGTDKEVWVGRYVVRDCGEYVIIVNSRKKFIEGHTHVNSMSQGKWLAEMAKYRIVPRRSTIRDLCSIIRITDDKKYARKLWKICDRRIREGKDGFDYNIEKE